MPILLKSLNDRIVKVVFIGERLFSAKVADDFPLFVVGEFHRACNRLSIFTNAMVNSASTIASDCVILGSFVLP